MTRSIPSRLPIPLLLLAFAACGGDSGQGGQSDSTPAASPAPAPAAAAPADDAALADAGEQLFTTRACNACHTIGSGRLVGPDLTGVTDRRSYEWIVSMITAPDSMIKDDPTAKQLFAEYMTPMANQGLSRDEATALYHFLRRSSAP